MGVSALTKIRPRLVFKIVIECFYQNRSAFRTNLICRTVCRRTARVVGYCDNNVFCNAIVICRVGRSERVQQVGIWLQKNGEAVYNSERCDLIGSSQPGLVDLNLQGPWTRKGNIGYWCIFRWPGNTATAVMVDTPVKRVTLLATGEEFKYQWNATTGRLQIFGLPALPPDPLASVLKVEFEDIPRRKKEEDLSSWISGN